VKNENFQNYIDLIERNYHQVNQSFLKGVQSILHELELNMNEMRILKMLYKNDNQNSTAIANEIGVSNSHMTSLTDALVCKGYLLRERSIKDRRVVEFSISSSGRDMAKTLESRIADYLYEKFKVLSIREMDSLNQIYEKLK
jgi:DNA-binding MarR family transcriptional regulator